MPTDQAESPTSSTSNLTSPIPAGQPSPLGWSGQRSKIYQAFVASSTENQPLTFSSTVNQALSDQGEMQVLTKLAQRTVRIAPDLYLQVTHAKGWPAVQCMLIVC